VKNAVEVIKADLEHICRGAAAEFERLAGSDVLVVGGGGFLGYYLVQSVLHWNQTSGDPIRLTVWDNFMRGRPEWLAALEGTPNLTIRQHDITKPLPEQLPHFGYIVHAASIASPNFYRKFPIETMDANVNGLRSLLEYCRAEQQSGFGVRGFLYFSTSEIYGDPDAAHIPTDEDYRGNVSCIGPRACYDESKRYGETLCVNFAQQYDLPIKIARPFNNYGPGLKITDRRVLPDFARDIFAGRDITLLSDGSPTRTFCYVADAIAGYLKILVIGRSGRPYNIGTEKPEISVLDFAKLVVNTAGEHFGYGGKLVQRVSEDRHYLTDNPLRRCPSIGRARSELGYEPEVTLEDGILRTLMWYRDNQGGSEA
jgi:UDP-glucuronate decarboxylase